MVITLLVFEIGLDSPWSLAAPEVAEAVDRPLAKDDRKRPFVPASSLAGSSRNTSGPTPSGSWVVRPRAPTVVA